MHPKRTNLQLEHDSVAGLSRHMRRIEKQLARATDNHGDHIALERRRRGCRAIRI
jgi:hypothetical protein